jgi:hypothetical protein
METDQFYSRSLRHDSPSKLFGIAKLSTGIILILYAGLQFGSLDTLVTAVKENDEIRIVDSVCITFVMTIIFLTSISFIFSGLRNFKKITVTPEVPPPLNSYSTIYDNLLKGKLDIYKFPDYGPLKFAYNYISDKIPFLTPPKRKVVAKNILSLRRFIFLVFVIIVAFIGQKFIPPEFYEELNMAPVSIGIPFVFLFILFIIIAIGFYTILLIVPENIPKQVFSENFATINGGGDPNSICPSIDRTLNDYRFNKLPNYSHKSGFAKTDELSLNESGSFSGSYAIETHPRYLPKKNIEIIPNLYLGLAFISVIISLIYFNTIQITELKTISFQNVLGKLIAGIIFLGTGSNFFTRAHLLFSNYQFESVFAYFDITGTIGKSEITAGKAITDSIETKNIVLRSDSQFKIYTTRFLSESYSLNGERYVTAMIMDEKVEEITHRVLQTIKDFKEEGVSVRGIDVTSESINKITQANLMIDKAKKSSRSLLSSGEQKKIIQNTEISVNDNITQSANDTKECPRCAETVKAKAKICRFCNYEF